MTRFSEIVGQKRAILLLQESVARGRLHHALLFSGPKGVGKRTTALAFAAYLLCESREGDDACGRCSACHTVAASYVNPNETSEKATTHPDLRFETIRPDPKTKKPRKLISIEQVRELQSFLAGRALVGGKKVAVVDEAQALSIDAQNAFLKTLEEPLGNALIILVAHNASALAATVRSRCQRMAFAPLDNGEIERILVERHGQSAEKARLAATFAGGSVGTALSPDIASLRSLTEDVSAFVARARAATQGEISDFARVFVPYEKITGPERVAGILRRLEIPLSILRGRLRDAASASDPGSPRAASLAAALRATEAAYEAWIGLRQNANPLLAVENMWLEIAESLARS